ncbi:alpha/beta hydrolase [Loigolactobacillus zhaoyuanensis]|uniref:Alpha/beta hydrolase n=1 Tax=Loigolactobacillus zhaoyuanensis TaxID=2486017 RepID=A0ABW8U8T2_9LACO
MTATIKLDIQYTTGLTLDWYQPQQEQLKGLIIAIHGGGWFQLDKAKDADVANWLVGQGYLVIVPNYRLAPEYHFPAPLQDMNALYEWLQQHAPQLPIAAIGASAGGNLAVELGLNYGLPVISLSGILDIAHWLTTHPAVVAKQKSAADTTTASAAINQSGANESFYKWFISNYLAADQAVAATPYQHVSSASGPMLLVNSMAEFVPMSGVARLSQCLIRSGVPAETIALAGSRHGKGYLDEVKANILLFLQRYLDRDQAK